MASQPRTCPVPFPLQALTVAMQRQEGCVRELREIERLFRLYSGSTSPRGSRTCGGGYRGKARPGATPEQRDLSVLWITIGDDTKTGEDASKDCGDRAKGKVSTLRWEYLHHPTLQLWWIRLPEMPFFSRDNHRDIADISREICKYLEEVGGENLDYLLAVVVELCNNGRQGTGAAPLPAGPSVGHPPPRPGPAPSATREGSDL